MKQIHEWALAHRIPLVAVHDLLQRLGMGFASPQVSVKPGMSEAAIQNNDRLDAGKRGVIIWRNNVGSLQDKAGRWVRFGLCNDSAALNENIKSGDGIGINPVLITPQMIGHTIGQFVSREYKHDGWVYTGQGREAAQAEWIRIVTAKGGDAAFCTGAGSFN